MELTNIKIKELKMFYSFKGKTFGFFEWMVHPLKESMSGGSTHESGRGGGTHGGCRTPPLYIEGWRLPSPQHTTSLPPPAAPPFGLRLGEALPKLILHHHHVVVLLEYFGGSSISAAPLEWGIGGRRQAVRVTEYGGAAHLQHPSSSRSWDRQVFVYTTHENRSR